MFRNLHIDDNDDWADIASRLERSVTGALGGGQPLAGHVVANLYVYTCELTTDKQRCLLRILYVCVNLRGLTIQNFFPGDLSGYNVGILHSASLIIQRILDALEPATTTGTIQFINFALQMDSTALEYILRLVGRQTNLRALFMYLKITTTCTHRIRIEERVLDRLHTLAFDMSWGVHCPLLSRLEHWSMPTAETLLTRGPDALTGLRELLDSQSLPSILDVSIECPSVFGTMEFPLSPRITSAMFSWHSTFFSGETNNVQIAYLIGEITPYDLRCVHGWTISAIFRTMVHIYCNKSLPSLQCICMADVEVKTLASAVWSPDVEIVWQLWCTMFEEAGISFVDKHNIPLSYIPFENSVLGFAVNPLADLQSFMPVFNW